MIHSRTPRTPVTTRRTIHRTATHALTYTHHAQTLTTHAPCTRTPRPPRPPRLPPPHHAHLATTPSHAVASPHASPTALASRLVMPHGSSVAGRRGASAFGGPCVARLPPLFCPLRCSNCRSTWARRVRKSGSFVRGAPVCSGALWGVRVQLVGGLGSVMRSRSSGSSCDALRLRAGCAPIQVRRESYNRLYWAKLQRDLYLR